MTDRHSRREFMGLTAAGVAGAADSASGWCDLGSSRGIRCGHKWANDCER